MNHIEKNSATPVAALRSGYLHSLDGWRAIAVLLVCCFHDRIHYSLFFNTKLLHQYGDMGVDIFFAISGLLICSRLLEEERRFGRIHLRGFYMRRLFRIQPASLLYLLTIGALAFFGFASIGRGAFLSALFLLRNYFPFHGPLSNLTTLTNHFWSLSFEEHFYLFLPAFLISVKRYRVPILFLMVALSTTWSVAVHKYHLQLIGPLPQWRTDLRAPSLLIPAIVALVLSNQDYKSVVRKWLNPYSAILLSSAFILWENLQMNTLSVFAAGLTFVLLVTGTMLHPQSLITRVLEWGPVRYLGRISFSIYLWQQLILVRPRWIPLIEYWQVRYIVLIAIASLSYYFIERPMIMLGHKLAPPATPGREDLDTSPGRVDLVAPI